MSDTDWIAVSTAFAAVGTVFGLLVALYRDWFLEWRGRPRLQIAFDPAGRRENLDLVTVGPPDGLVHWVRLRVSNATGCRSADNVEVFLLRCERREETRTQTPLNERPLSWSGIRESDGKTRITKTVIPPGVTRHVDLISIEREEGKPTASLRAVPTPRDERHKFSQGDYDVELILSAQNVDAKRYRGSVSYDGAWSDGDDMWQHVNVQFARAD
jgi:hypothetical protein